MRICMFYVEKKFFIPLFFSLLPQYCISIYINIKNVNKNLVKFVTPMLTSNLLFMKMAHNVDKSCISQMNVLSIRVNTHFVSYLKAVLPGKGITTFIFQS